MHEVPSWSDMTIEYEDGELGLRKMTITAHSQQAEIDLEMEHQRIVKLLERAEDHEQPE